jgi:hypothetical protein
MPTSPGTVERLALALGQALAPLKDRLSAGQIIELFAELGVRFPPALTTQGSFATAIQNAGNAAGQVPHQISQLAAAIEAQDEGQIISASLALIDAIKTLLQGIDAVATELPAAATAVGFDPGVAANFTAELLEKLMGYSIIRYLEGYAPVTLSVLGLAGLIDRVPIPTEGTTQPGHVDRLLRLDRFNDFFKAPGNLLSTVYRWGDPAFDGKELLRRIGDVFRAASLPASVDDAVDPIVLRLLALSISPKTDVSPPGLRIDVRADLPALGTLSIPLSSTGLSLEVVLEGDVTAGAGVVITPPADIALIPPSGSLQGSLMIRMVKSATGDQPIVLLGATAGSGLRAKAVKFGLGTSVQWDIATNSALGDFTVELDVSRGEIEIDLSDADSFIGFLFSNGDIRSSFDLTVGWSAHRGVFFSGGAALEINLPLHLSLGPVNLETLHLLFAFRGPGLALDTSLTASAALGPLQASVDRIGVTTFVKSQRGNLGPVDLSIGFKPPNGLGIAIDAGVVAGGGYIFFNPDKGQYAGVLDVALAEIIQVKIIGVLDTILPDGSHGFSFLLIITFDFPPIQLGFGFTLNGVGGLGGVNRTMNTDALHAGFRAHTLNSVLFPPDPIANAPQIISNIENFFPPAEGRYLFGPMLEIGWGTPTLITLAVGVILEVPDPIRVALLGLIDAGLPSTEVVLIELHIDVLGILDFGQKTLSIDGSLYDSRILIFSVAGDLALRLAWGDNPNFVFSLGGFNPHFNTTALDVPAMHRLSVSIGDGDNPRISANSYYAITSNSVQFGANVEAYAEAGGFSIHGYLGFDVLFIISPFSFEFDFSAGFDVSFEDVGLFGLNVHGTFSGPRPWHLNGEACIDILFFSICGSVNLTWGDSTPAILPQKPVLPDLMAAFQDARNWSAALPDGTTQAVTLSTPKPDDKTLRVHPMGTLTVRENVVPLDLPITRYGNATPSDGSFFSISDVQIDGQEETKQSIMDYFAAGQFLTLSDADKVSRPSFERYDAGVTIGSSTITAGADSPRTVVYEERYIDEPSGFSRFSRRYLMTADVHLALTRQGAGFASPLKNTGLFKYTNGASGPAIKTQDPSYVVAQMDDLSVRSDIVSSEGKTYFQTRAALDSHLALHPEETDNLQILPVHEVAA